MREPQTRADRASSASILGFLISRWRLVVGLAFVVVLTTACQADLTVDVTVEEDGSGVVNAEVVLNAEASDALLDLEPGQTLPLTDLAQAGWEIGPPARGEDGSTTVTARKAFGSFSQFGEVMGELTDETVLRDFDVTRQQSFGVVEYAATGVIDPTVGLAAFSDPALDAALGGPLESIITEPPYNATADDVNISVSIALPGELQEDGSTSSVQPDELSPVGVWQTSLAGQQVQDVSLLTVRRSISAQVLRGVAVVAGVLAALVVFAQLLRVASGLRRRRPTEAKVRPTDARGRSAAEVTQEVELELLEEIEEPEIEEESSYKVVALDGMGVLYRESDDVNELLIPFARERGSTVTDEEIRVKMRQLSLGRLTPAEFWQVIDVEGEPNELDSAYLSTHQLMPGVVKYLRSVRDGGVRAACITNDAAAWAMKLRAGQSLEGLIDPWVISGSVGVRKPDAPLFEVLRRVTGEQPSAILIIDDDLENLDAARELGFGTAWFSAEADKAQARGHDLFRNFDAMAAATGTVTGTLAGAANGESSESGEAEPLVTD